MRSFLGTLGEGERVVAERVVGICYQDACQGHNLSGSALCSAAPGLVIGRQYTLTIDCGKAFALSPTNLTVGPGTTVITFETSDAPCRSCTYRHTL